MGKDEIRLDHLISGCRGRANRHAYKGDLVFAAEALHNTCWSDVCNITLVLGVGNRTNVVMAAPYLCQLSQSSCLVHV